jgi:hypothetical protein
MAQPAAGIFCRFDLAAQLVIMGGGNWLGTDPSGQGRMINPVRSRAGMTGMGRAPRAEGGEQG